MNQLNLNLLLTKNVVWIMLKALACIIVTLGLVLGGLLIWTINSPLLRRNNAAYESWPVMYAAGDYWEAKGKLPKTMNDLLSYSRSKGTENVKRIEEFLKDYDPIVMVRWHPPKKGKMEDGFIGDLWFKPTRNCATDWISVTDGNNTRPNQYPPPDAAYLFVPGGPKP